MKNVAITDYTFEDLSVEKNIFDKHGIKLENIIVNKLIKYMKNTPIYNCKI